MTHWLSLPSAQHKPPHLRAICTHPAAGATAGTTVAPTTTAATRTSPSDPTWSRRRDGPVPSRRSSRGGWSTVARVVASSRASLGGGDADIAAADVATSASYQASFEGFLVSG